MFQFEKRAQCVFTQEGFKGRGGGSDRQTRGFVSQNEEAEMLSARRHSQQDSVPFPFV